MYHVFCLFLRLLAMLTTRSATVEGQCGRLGVMEKTLPWSRYVTDSQGPEKVRCSEPHTLILTSLWAATFQCWRAVRLV